MTELISPLHNQVQNVLKINTKDEELIKSMEFLFSFYSIKEKSDFKGKLEKRLLSSHKDLYTKYKRVTEDIKTLKTACSQIQGSYKKLSDDLTMSRENTKNLLLKIEGNVNKISQLDREEVYLKEFIQNYQLTALEKEVIMIGELDPDFFTTLNKVNEIYNRAASQLRDQRICIDIMDEMSIYLETAYDRISRYIQNKTYFANDTTFELSLKALKERPVLLDLVLKDIIVSRKELLMKRFFQALTGKRVPIEMTAHDPIKYIGDILGWIHQDCASERELFENLDIKKETLLNDIYETLCPNIKIKLDQVLNYSSPEVVFKLSELLNVYSVIIGKILGNPNHISTLLSVSKQVFVDKYIEQLHVASIKFDVTKDLLPPKELSDLLLALSKIKKTEDYQNILKIVFQPILDLLKKMSVNTMDEFVFKINCLFLINESEMPKDRSDVPGSPSPWLTPRTTPRRDSFGRSDMIMIKSPTLPSSRSGEDVSRMDSIDEQRRIQDMIQFEMEKTIEMLIQRESQALLKSLEFEGVLDVISRKKNEETLASLLDEDKLGLTVRAFYNSLFSVGSQLIVDKTLKISNSKIKSYVRNRISTELLDAYTLIYNSVMEEKNQYKKPQEMMFHNSKKIRILLEVQ